MITWMLFIIVGSLPFVGRFEGTVAGVTQEGSEKYPLMHSRIVQPTRRMTRRRWWWWWMKIVLSWRIVARRGRKKRRRWW